MATVYVANDGRQARRVAVKVLRPELSLELGADRFVREIHLAARLNHPHIMPLFDSGEAGGFLYYVMPVVEGESLRERLKQAKRLLVEDATQIAQEVADALDYAHRHGVVHRDIKPENILLQEGRAVVADFGIGKAVSAAAQGATAITRTGVTVGTPAYMSPEQAAGEQAIDGRSDIYSLGCVLYEMLAGAPPFTGPTAQAVIAAHLTTPPRPLTELRRAVARANGLPAAVGLSRWLTWQRTLGGGGLAFGALGVGAAGYMAMRLLGIGPVGTLVASGVLKNREPLILADFENRATDSTLGPSLTAALRVDLSESPAVRLMDGAAIAEALRRLERRPTTPLDPGPAAGIAER